MHWVVSFFAGHAGDEALPACSQSLHPFSFQENEKCRTKKIDVTRIDDSEFWTVCLSFESGCGRLHWAALPSLSLARCFWTNLERGSGATRHNHHNHLGTWDLRIKFEVSSVSSHGYQITSSQAASKPTTEWLQDVVVEILDELWALDEGRCAVSARCRVKHIIAINRGWDDADMLICWYGRCSRDIQRLVLQFSIFEERKLKPSMAGLWAKTCCTSSIFGHRMSFEHLDTYLQPDPSGAQERLEEDLGWMLMQCLERENEKQRVGGQWPARQSPAVLRGQLLLKSSVISADSHLWQAVTGHLESMLETREDMNNKQISRSEWMHQANSSNNRTLLCPCWRHSLAVTCRLAEDILLDEQVPALRTTLAERLDNTGGCKEESPKDFRLVPASSQFFFHYCGSLLNLLRYLILSHDISDLRHLHCPKIPSFLQLWRYASFRLQYLSSSCCRKEIWVGWLLCHSSLCSIDAVGIFAVFTSASQSDASNFWPLEQLHVGTRGWFEEHSPLILYSYVFVFFRIRTLANLSVWTFE